MRIFGREETPEQKRGRINEGKRQKRRREQIDKWERKAQRTREKRRWWQ